MSKARIVWKNKMEKKNRTYHRRRYTTGKCTFIGHTSCSVLSNVPRSYWARACALSRVKCPHDLLFALSPFLFLSFSTHRLCTATTTVYVSWNSVSQTGISNRAFRKIRKRTINFSHERKERNILLPCEVKLVLIASIDPRDIPPRDEILFLSWRNYLISISASRNRVDFS